jgi:hypothetical protein
MSSANVETTTISAPDAGAVTVSRRRVLVNAAALATTTGAIASATATTDRVFFVIDNHRQAFARWLASLAEIARLENELPKEARRWSVAYADDPLEPPADCTDDPRWIAAEQATHATYDVESNARHDLAAVVPDTLAGAVALIRYVLAYYDGRYEGARTDAPHELFGEEAPLCTMLSGVAHCIARHIAA